MKKGNLKKELMCLQILGMLLSSSGCGREDKSFMYVKNYNKLKEYINDIEEVKNNTSFEDYTNKKDNIFYSDSKKEYLINREEAFDNLLNNIDSSSIFEDIIYKEAFKEAIYENKISFSDDDYYCLNHLTVKIGTIMEKGTLAFYEAPFTLIVDYNKINEITKDYSNEEKVDFCKRVFLHELNHLKQTQIYEAGYHFSFSDDYYFLTEASAESNLYNYNDNFNKFNIDNKDYAYFNNRFLENLLFTTVLCDNSKEINGYYDAIFSGNEKEFNDFFELKNEKDKNEFYNCLYYMNSVLYNTSLSSDILKDASASQRLDYLSIYYEIPLFKKSIVNLMDAIITDKLSLEESVYLYNVIKTNYLCLKSYSDDFVRDFLNIEKVFYNFLDEKYEKHEANIENIDFTYLNDKYPLLDNILFTGYYDLEYNNGFVRKREKDE